jgi:hypothetical protein
VAESDAKVRFYREGFDRLGEGTLFVLKCAISISHEAHCYTGVNHNVVSWRLPSAPARDYCV